jgi:hypothetical protein
MSTGRRSIAPFSGRPIIALSKKAAWLVSLMVHLVFLLLISLFTTHDSRAVPTLVLRSDPIEQTPIEKLVPDAFHFDPTPRETIGGSSLGGLDDNAAGRPKVEQLFEVPALELPPQEIGQIDSRQLSEAATGPQSDLNQTVKGAAGIGVTGADGAIDRITQEILLSLEERKTLVVWFFDRSGSLQTQRESILRRFNRVYQELGVVQTGDNRAFRHRDTPLLTAVVAFGADANFLIDEPTDELPLIKRAVESITLDESGIERVFTAFQAAAQRYKKYRTALDRNLMFVAFTDEAGDDADGLDQTVDLCRRLTIPVYVVGVPAPFGRKETLVKWVDPDPTYDQTPQWGRVDQGPESLLVEGVQIAFSGFREDEAPIDSGFGPFALTRLCYETGGIYFTVHPNRLADRRVSRRETATYSAYFSAFFDPLRMRRYRPDYVSAKEYVSKVQQSPVRSSLVQAAQLSALQPLDTPRLRFVVRSEAQLASELTEAQKDAARIEPALEQLNQLFKAGEADRPKETVPRWQAGYDLAYGRVLASKVRAEGYNAVLAEAKRGMKFSDPKYNTWQLRPSDEISGGSRLQRDAEQARRYLERVTREHEGTPWALLAQRELAQPLGWQWQEAFTPIDPPGAPAETVNAANVAPRDEQARRLAPPVKHRPPPKL